MSSLQAAPSVIFIVGPTATGKSALASRLAEHFDGAILNCDSLQVYRRLDIGTAKPSRAERDRVPHLLFDCMGPGDVLTAGDFRRAALSSIEEWTKTGRGPVFAVGGSGFYIQALEKGMFDVSKPRPEVETAVRSRLDKNGLSSLYAELERRDPEYAERVDPNDSYRIVRALVLMDDSGRTVSEVRNSFVRVDFPYPLLKLGMSLPREELLARVKSRTEAMLNAGFVEEVQALLEDGYTQWPPLQSVGYKECVSFLKGTIPSRAVLAATIVEKTMQLAKKQKTWFKRDMEIHWLTPEAAFDQAERLVADFCESGS